MNIRVVEAINEQINSELSASYSYLDSMNLFDFILARDQQVVLKPLEQPRQGFSSMLEVFERALSQEQEVSRQIDALYEIAFQEKAFAAVAELQWFLTEQVEEEKTGREIVGKLQMIGSGSRRRRRATNRQAAETDRPHGRWQM